MTFPRYEKYKDSGVEWLREVPAGWGVAPLKTVATYNDDSLDETTSPDTEILYVDISGVDALDGITAKEPMLFGASPSRARRRVKHGDTIVSTVRTYLRAIARVRNPEGNLIVSTGFAVVRPRVDLSPDFVGYVLSAAYFIEQVIARSTGVSYPAINASELVRIAVPLPPLPEQTAIAVFLDRETSKIDALVVEQRRLMELLKEKRQAVISHAVTKGLDPNARMKPSGIEWLGDVPAHWEVAGLTKYLALLVDYRGRTPTKVDEGVFLVTARNIRDGHIDYAASEEFVAAAEYEDVMRRGKPELGDVLFTTEAPLGQVANVDRTDVALAQRVIKLRGKPDVLDNYFLKYWMLGAFSQGDMERLATGSTALGIKGSKVVQLRLCLPPIDEQLSIAAYLDEQLAKLDTLTTEAEGAIELLQERRTALVSAAVTGQIDVRGVVA